VFYQRVVNDSERHAHTLSQWCALPYAYVMPVTERDQWEAGCEKPSRWLFAPPVRVMFPVGALVISPDGEIVASGHNTRQRDQ
jgi:hypothetical protein